MSSGSFGEGGLRVPQAPRPACESDPPPPRCWPPARHSRTVLAPADTGARRPSALGCRPWPTAHRRALALGHALLNVNHQIDAPGRAGASWGASGWAAPPAITARMSSGSKPAPRVEARRRVGLSCPGARNEITPPRPCLTAKPDSSMSRRNAAKSAGFLQGHDDSQPHPLLGRGRLFPDPLTVMEKTALAVQFGIWI